jgi:anti-sigma regulatory factor (Ser/Thr protein kinase)
MGAVSNKPCETRPAVEREAAPEAARRILFVVPQEGLFSQVVQARLADHGWDVRLVDEPGHVLDALEPEVALILLDACFPDAHGLLRLIKLHSGTGAVPVVAVFPHGYVPLRPPELRFRADVEFVEPFDLAHLVDIAERQAARAAEATPAPDRDVRLILPSRQADLERAFEVASLLLRTSGLDAAEQTALLTAFREAVGNAIQHGNRRDSNRCVQVHYRQGPDAITIVVRDEGEGFDPHLYLRQAIQKDAAQAARDRHNKGGQGGLGILMIVRCTDSVDYNKKGNVVTLTKLLPKPPPTASV